MGLPLFRRQAGLLRHAGFRLLFLATLGSGVGTWLAFIALQIDVKDRTDSGTWISALLLAEIVPMLVVGVLLGPVIDRLSRRTIMIGADIARFAVFAFLPFAGSPGVIVALAAIAGFATGLFRPAVYAALPNLVEDRDLPSANGLIQTVENFTTVLAPVAGGALVAATTPDVPYVVNAFSFLISALLLARISGSLREQAEVESHGHWRDLVAGFAVVKQSRALVVVLVAWTIVAAAGTGAVNVAEIFLAKDSFRAGDFGFGLLVAAAGVGLVLGSFFAASALDRLTTRNSYGLSLSLMALGIAGAAVSPNVWVAAGCIAISGVGNGAAVVNNALLVQRGVRDEFRGRAFTVLMSSTWIFVGLGMVVAGELVNAVGARWVWAAAGLAIAASAAIAFALTPEVSGAHAADDERQPPDRDLAALEID